MQFALRNVRYKRRGNGVTFFCTVMEVVSVKDEWSTEFFLQIAKDVLLMGVWESSRNLFIVAVCLGFSTIISIFSAVSLWTVFGAFIIAKKIS